MTFYYYFYLSSLFWSGAACLIFGIYNYYRSHTRSALTYLHLCSALGILSFTYCLTAAVPNYQFALAAYYLTLLGMFLFFPLFLHFALIFTGRDPKWWPWIYVPSIISCLFIFFSPSYRIELLPLPIGYYHPLGGILLFYLLFHVGYILTGQYLIWTTFGHSAKSYERLQARTIVWAGFIPITLGALIDQTMVMIGRPDLIFSPHLAAFSVGLIGYVLFRYSPIRQLKKGQVAESAAAAFPQGLFLTDREERISFVNQSALKLLDRRADQVVGNQLSAFVGAVREGMAEIKPRHGVSSVYIDLIVTQLPEGQGRIYLARDLTPLRSAQQDLKQLNEDLRRSLAKENNLEKWISVLAGLIDEKEINETWQKLLAEEPDLKEALTPVYKNGLEQARAFQEAELARKELNKKIEEVDWLSHFMAGREELLSELQTELKRLSA